MENNFLSLIKTRRMESFDLRPIEKAKTDCAKKLFNEMSNSKVRYSVVNDYQNLLNIMNTL